MDRIKAIGIVVSSVHKLRKWCNEMIAERKLCVADDPQGTDEIETCEITMFGFIGAFLARAGLKSRWGPPYEGYSVDIILRALDIPIMGLGICHKECKLQADKMITEVFNEAQSVVDCVKGFELGIKVLDDSAAGMKRPGAELLPEALKRLAN
jgi:hypothetical protein